MFTPLLGHNNLLELEDTLDLPFFENNRTHDIHWLPHVPLSGVVHLGSRNSRHFITFVKAWNPHYELDDAKPAKTHQRLLDWAKRRLVLIWLRPAPCKADSTAPSLEDMCASPINRSGPMPTQEHDEAMPLEHPADDTEASDESALDVSWLAA